MFETNVELKAMFSSLKNVTTTAELRTNKVLESHAMKVICVIDDAISNLDDMDYVIRLLELTAHKHCQRFPHFDAEYFWVCEYLPCFGKFGYSGIAWVISDLGGPQF